MAAPTDPYALLHWNMVNAHQTFKLGYDNILKHLDNPPLDDLWNFLGYCEAWMLSITCHHDSEEAIVFPFLNQRMDFSSEASAHKVIHEKFDQLIAKINEAKAELSKFDATALKALMIESKTILFSHLDDEVEHILPAKLQDAGFTELELVDMIGKLETHAKGNGNPFLLVPFMRSHTPAESKDIWPPLPWIVRKVLVPYLLAMRHYGYWKYSPYPMS